MGDFMGKGVFAPAEAAAVFGIDMIKFADCARWLVTRLHPDGAKCPGCSAGITGHNRLARWYNLEQIRCPECGKKFTAKTGNILNDTKLEAREIYLLAVLIYLEVAPARIATILQIHTDTVRNWQMKFNVLGEGMSG